MNFTILHAALPVAVAAMLMLINPLSWRRSGSRGKVSKPGAPTWPRTWTTSTTSSASTTRSKARAATMRRTRGIKHDVKNGVGSARC